jgi:exonuclease SbcC
MKPLSLTLTAFGSYPGTEVIDFTALSGLGLYVVTGPTGSGKTTVFDAMAYALYGDVPGVRETDDVRSHHADPSVLCSVTFRFEVDGVAYRVERSPEQFRAGKRKGAELVKQASVAVLVRESDNVTLASRAGATARSAKAIDATKVADACAGLIGLSADQFERVVLLPQGRFQQFLLATTAERQPLLRQLFDTRRWLTVNERLKERMNEAKDAVAAFEAQLSNHRHSLIGNLRNAAEYLHHEVPLLLDEDAIAIVSLDSLGELHAELDAVASGRRGAARTASDASQKASELEAKATRIVDDWTARRDLRAVAVALDEQAPTIEIARARLVADASAQPVVIAFTALHAAALAADSATATRNTTRQAVIDACAPAGVVAHESLEALVTAIADARSAVATQRRAFDAVVNASTKLQKASTSLDSSTVERAGITDRLVEIDADLEVRDNRLAELAPVADQLEVQQREVTTAADRRAAAARVADLVMKKEDAAAALVVATNEQQILLARFIADAAPRLAAQLVPEQPCPVCGGTEHPAPASSDSGAPVDASELDQSAGVISKAAAAVEAVETELAMRRSSLGDDASLPVEQFEELLRDAQAAVARSEAAVRERDDLAVAVEAIRVDRDGLVRRATELDVDLDRLGAEQAAAVIELDAARGGLGALAERFDTEGAALVAVFERRSQAIDQLDAATTRWSRALTEFENALGAVRTTETLLADAVLASGFVDPAAAEAAVVEPSERVALEAEVAAHDTGRASINARLPELEALDLPVECPDITALHDDAATKRSTAQALADDVSRIDERLGQASDDLEAARLISASAAGAFERADQLIALARTCDGQGPRKVSLETWVLAGELDRVVIAASIHLERMTAGRYRLDRTDAGNNGKAQAGLELLVLDAHTGVARPPSSLSGGEQFQASLALALGLADVVSQGGSASGRVFEALFVDEGFGSLDPESLGQAVDALHQIHATGRTVGVITHVEAMKEDLQLGIRVDRLPDGNGSTLACHPEI